MDFAKIIIMFIFMNIIVSSSTFVINKQLDVSLENNGFNDLVFDNNGLTVVSEDSGLTSTYYQATIGNAIDWGRGLLQFIGFASQDASISGEYHAKYELFPVTAMILTIILTFQWLANMWVGFKTYQFIFNKG
jgi:hypothetical protein